MVTLRWRHDGRDSVSNHQPHDCLLNRLFRRRSKKTSKLRATSLCARNSPGPVNSPHKWPVTRKMFPFDDVIMKRDDYIWSSRAIHLWFHKYNVGTPYSDVTLASSRLKSPEDRLCQQRVSEVRRWQTRQIWGIWKLRPAYSPEMPNLGQNRWCFVPCDLEIWWMTLENNRASLLCCFKLCATFHSHWWIQTGVTVRKHPIWVKFEDF